MSFLAVKLLKAGYSQAKKHKANKQQQQDQARSFQQPTYPVQFPEPYPMAAYPPGMAPGSNIPLQPQPAHLPPYQYQYQYPPGAAPAAPTSAPAPPAGEGEEEPTKKSKTSTPPKLLSMLITIIRIIQFITGLVVMGLYGADIHQQQTNNTLNPKWGFAVITSFLATCTAFMYLLIPCCLRRVRSTFSPNLSLILARFVWEFGLVVAWLTLFGIFGKMYLGVNPASASGTGKRDLNSTSSSNSRAASMGGGNVNGTGTATTTATGAGAGTGNSGLGDASKINRMQHAVWVDLANLAMWAVTASWLMLRWFKGRRAAKSGDGEKGGDA